MSLLSAHFSPARLAWRHFGEQSKWVQVNVRRIIFKILFDPAPPISVISTFINSRLTLYSCLCSNNFDVSNSKSICEQLAYQRLVSPMKATLHFTTTLSLLFWWIFIYNLNNTHQYNKQLFRIIIQWWLCALRQLQLRAESKNHDESFPSLKHGDL